MLTLEGTLRHAPARTVRVETLVIGGGQAGLAIGQQLGERDIDVLILEAGSRVGDAWRKRWDSLRLFTPALRNGLPGMPFPAPASHLPDKDEVADYLERYAERFDLPIELDTQVESLEWDGERYVARAGERTFEAESVVVATGPFQRPRVPALAARLSAGIRQLHSSEYRNPLDLPEGPVLVVGVGNSGAQIAMEVARCHPVWLAGEPVGHIPRRFLGRDIYDWLWPLMSRLTVDTRLGRRMREKMRRGDPLVGIPASAFAASGVRRVGRMTEVRDGLPVCDGEVIAPRTIVWSTGFRPDFSWIRLPILGEDGYPRHERGVTIGQPGLFFIGLRFQYRMMSALLGGVGGDAARIAEAVSRHAAVVAESTAM